MGALKLVDALKSYRQLSLPVLRVLKKLFSQPGDQSAARKWGVGPRCICVLHAMRAERGEVSCSPRLAEPCSLDICYKRNRAIARIFAQRPGVFLRFDGDRAFICISKTTLV